jgi:hypothetical protein
MVCVVCCKCSQKKEVFLIWVVDLVRAVETGGRGGGTRVDVVLGLILKCFVGGLIDEEGGKWLPFRFVEVLRLYRNQMHQQRRLGVDCGQVSTIISQNITSFGLRGSV